MVQILYVLQDPTLPDPWVPHIAFSYLSRDNVEWTSELASRVDRANPGTFWQIMAAYRVPENKPD